MGHLIMVCLKKQILFFAWNYITLKSISSAQVVERLRDRANSSPSLWLNGEMVAAISPSFE